MYTSEQIAKEAFEAGFVKEAERLGVTQFEYEVPVSVLLQGSL